MKNYYSDPMTRNLIVHDTESGEIRILEKIEKVRVFTVSEVKLGDFNGPNHGPAVDEYDSVGGYQNVLLNPQGRRPSLKGTAKGGAPSKHPTGEKKQRHCRRCGGTHGPRGLCPAPKLSLPVSDMPPADVAAEIRSETPLEP